MDKKKTDIILNDEIYEMLKLINQFEGSFQQDIIKALNILLSSLCKVRQDKLIKE